MPYLGKIMITVYQWMSYISAGLFVYLMICVVLAFLVRSSPKATRFICNSGIISAFMIAANCGALYVWHHFYR